MSPVCGHYFWNNQNGAKSFCKKLGYIDGTQNGFKSGQTYSEDAIRVGRCNPGEDLESCSNKCNDKELGNINEKGCSNCAAGQPVKITITCDGHVQNTKASTCRGKAIKREVIFIYYEKTNFVEKLEFKL